MKRLIITFLLMLSVMTSCTQRRATGIPVTESQESTTSMDAYLAFAGHFSESSSFAFANVGGSQVMLVSQETFGNNVNSDMEAIAASVFALDGKGKILSLGSVRSQGTLYPVSLLDGKLMVAGHQFVRIYSVRGEVPELVLDSYGEGDGPELEAWFNTFEKGTPIKFCKNCKTASTTNAEAKGLSIFDKLAGDMVYVEQNTRSFYICKYEVTQKLWNAVMGENPSNMQGDDLPVEQVSWNDCQTFISKLNELTGKQYRLPSEAEWEYACRGGSWIHNARNCDPSRPNETPQTFSINSLGLRLAL